MCTCPPMSNFCNFWNILCPVRRYFWGKKIKLLFFTQKVGTCRSRLQWDRRAGNENIAYGGCGEAGRQRWMPQEQKPWCCSALILTRGLTWREPHPPAQGSQDGSRVTAATWDVNHLRAMSWQGFMHRQIIFCLPFFLIMVVLNLLGWRLWGGWSFTMRSTGCYPVASQEYLEVQPTAEVRYMAANSGSFCLGNAGKNGHGSWSLLYGVRLFSVFICRM